MQQPLISVLVITYNQERYIRQTLETIVRQEGDFRVEMVVSNDCSTDKTDTVIRTFMENYKGPVTIRYFQQKTNLGILLNLIFALEQCSGDYLAMCEGDDFWLTNDKLQKQLALLQKHHDCALVITNRKVIREDHSAYDERYDEFYKKQIFTATDIIQGFVPGLQTLLARNDHGLSRYLSGNNDLGHADQYIAYYYSLQGKIYLLSEITAAYRMTGSGAWSSHSSLQKLQVKTEMLADFHRRIGLPMTNAVLRKTQLNCSYATLRYCLKRPAELRIRSNWQWIQLIWKTFWFGTRTRVGKGIFINTK
ncbi:glycosyltransferase [Flavisolibacter sp. BT320]|nr:glycosyltransferase [Flavisolibacter longurius]